MTWRPSRLVKVTVNITLALASWALVVVLIAQTGKALDSLLPDPEGAVVIAERPTASNMTLGNIEAGRFE